MLKVPLGPNRSLIAIVPTPRFSAAAIIRAGEVSVSDVHVWDVQRFHSLEEKCRIVEERMTSLLRSAGVRAAVVGIPLADNGRTTRMRAQVLTVLKRKRIPTAVRDLRDTRTAILGRLRGRGPDALPKAIVRGYAPALEPLLRPNRLAGYYWRNAFEAVALGLIHVGALSSLETENFEDHGSSPTATSGN